jgi:1,4-dihydroxy-2-naphthoate octaprenyltransferase
LVFISFVSFSSTLGFFYRHMYTFSFLSFGLMCLLQAYTHTGSAAPIIYRQWGGYASKQEKAASLCSILITTDITV